MPTLRQEPNVKRNAKAPIAQVQAGKNDDKPQRPARDDLRQPRDGDEKPCDS